MSFTAHEPLANISYLAELIIWILTLVVWVYPPHLWAVALESWRQHSAESGAVYITRFVPYNLFRFLIYLLGSLSGGVLLLRLGAGFDLLPTDNYDALLLYLLGGSVGVYLFLYLRSVMFKLWRYVLFEPQSGALLTQDYFFQDWLRALALAGLSLLSFADLPASLLAWLSLGTLVAIQLLGWVQLIRRTKGASTGFLYLFSYLCAHEVVPYLYIIVAGTYLTRSSLLPNL